MKAHRKLSEKRVDSNENKTKKEKSIKEFTAKK